jgi:hypothetical protein
MALAVGERNRPGGVHLCRNANERCGRWRWLRPGAPRWFCDRTCELIWTASKRALSGQEAEELIGLIHDQGRVIAA